MPFRALPVKFGIIALATFTQNTMAIDEAPSETFFLYPEPPLIQEKAFTLLSITPQK